MLKRDESLIKLRPEIDFGDIPQPLNQLQGVLRQILKFQNDALVINVLHYLKDKHKGYTGLDHLSRLELLSKSLKNDIPLKKDLIGMVKGLFTADELNEYLTNQKEINKRLLEFIYKRVSEQIA